MSLSIGDCVGGRTMGFPAGADTFGDGHTADVPELDVDVATLCVDCGRYATPSADLFRGIDAGAAVEVAAHEGDVGSFSD